MTQEPSGGSSMESEACLTRLLMSPVTRFWVGCAIIVMAPWVLLLERPAKEERWATEIKVTGDFGEEWELDDDTKL